MPAAEAAHVQHIRVIDIRSRENQMKVIIFILYITIFSSMGYAQNTVSLDAHEKEKLQTTQSKYFPLLIDSDLSMRSGSEDIITFHQGLALLEDYLIGTTWFPKFSFLGKTGNVLARAAKYVVLDTPVDYFSIILAHEYFGHGARYRELNFDHIDYGYDWPPPYGPGGGYASLGIDDPISRHELLAILEIGYKSTGFLEGYDLDSTPIVIIGLALKK